MWTAFVRRETWTVSAIDAAISKAANCHHKVFSAASHAILRGFRAVMSGLSNEMQFPQVGVEAEGRRHACVSV